jgi:glutamine amidotransferase
MCDEAIATSENGVQFAAALNKGNFYGTQFHPEKSGMIGEQIIKNFVEKC